MSFPGKTLLLTNSNPASASIYRNDVMIQGDFTFQSKAPVSHVMDKAKTRLPLLEGLMTRSRGKLWEKTKLSGHQHFWDKSNGHEIQRQRTLK